MSYAYSGSTFCDRCQLRTTAAANTTTNDANVITRVASPILLFMFAKSRGCRSSGSRSEIATSSSSIRGRSLGNGQGFLASLRGRRDGERNRLSGEPGYHGVGAQRDRDDKEHIEPGQGPDQVPVHFHGVAGIGGPDLDDRRQQSDRADDDEEPPAALERGRAQPGGGQ